jgi:rod shape-determining protein MreC
VELRFVPLNADFQSGDRLVTSGIDGVYPRGLPVADVTTVERSGEYLFARITCRPLAGVANNAHVLIADAEREIPERPPEEDRTARPRKSRKGS